MCESHKIPVELVVVYSVAAAYPWVPLAAGNHLTSCCMHLESSGAVGVARVVVERCTCHQGCQTSAAAVHWCPCIVP